MTTAFIHAWTVHASHILDMMWESKAGADV